MTMTEIKRKAKTVLKTGRNHGNLLLSDVLAAVVNAIPLIGTVCFPCVYLGGKQIYLDAVDGRETDLRTLYSKFKKQFGSSFFFFLCATVMGIVAVMAVLIVCVFLNTVFSLIKPDFLMGLVVIIGIILFIILFFFVVIITDAGYHVLLREPEIDGVEALKKGWVIASNNVTVFLGLFFSFFGWWLLLLPTLGLIMIYVGPYYEIAHTILLEQLYNSGNESMNTDCNDNQQFGEE